MSAQDTVNGWFPTADGSAFVDTSYNQPRTPDTVVQNMANAGQDVTTTGADGWGGWLQKVGSGLLSYAVAKDANQTAAGLAKQQAANIPMVPIQTTAMQGGALTINSNMLLIGALAVAGFVALRK